MQTLRKQYIEYRREKQSPITMDNHAHAHHHKHMYFCLFNCLFVYLRLLSVIVVQQKLYFRTSRHFRRWGGQNAHTRKKKKKSYTFVLINIDGTVIINMKKLTKIIYRQKRIKSLSSEVFQYQNQ